MLDVCRGRRTQVVKGEVCKTSMQRFESARRLHTSLFLKISVHIVCIIEKIPRTLKPQK